MTSSSLLGGPGVLVLPVVCFWKVAIVESALVAVSAEVGARGYDWLRESSATANAPLQAAQDATRGTEVTVDELRSAFARASEGQTHREFATQPTDDVIGTVVAELEVEGDAAVRTVVETYLEELETRLVGDESGHELLLEYLRAIEGNLSDLVADLEQTRYYRAFPGAESEAAIARLRDQVGLIDTLEYVTRPELPAELSRQHLIVGRKGSGKSRALLRYAKQRLDRCDIGTVLLPSPAVQRFDDVRAALMRDYHGDVLLLWDDIHSINRPDQNNVFYEFVQKLEANLDAGQQLHVIATCRSEEQGSLQHYDHWEEDRVWKGFDRTRLQPLEDETLESMIDEVIAAYGLAFEEGIREQFREFVETGSPSPFYLSSAGHFLASEKQSEPPEGVVTHSDVLDIPPSMRDVWKEQYERVCRELDEARYILLAVKILDRVSSQYDRELVRGLFVEVFNREPFDFDRALQRLHVRQWIIFGDSDETLHLHDIQIAGIDDDINRLYEKFASFLIESAHEYVDAEVAMGLCQKFLMRLLLNPSREDESVIEETTEQLLASDILEKMSSEVTWVVHLNYGGYLHSNNRPVEALEHTTKAIQMRPEDATSYVNHAAAASNAGLDGIAEGAYRRSIELTDDDPDRAFLRTTFAEFLGSKDRSNDATEMFVAAIEESDENPVICQRYARYLETVDQIGIARGWHQTALEKSDALETKAQFASFLRRHGPVEQFEELESELLQLTPEGIESLEDVLRTVNGPQLQVQPGTHNQLTLEEREDYQVAEEAREIADREGPKAAAAWLTDRVGEFESPPLYGTTGDYWVAAGEIEQAVAMYEQGLTLTSEQAGPQTVVEPAKFSCTELEEADAEEAAVALCDFVLEQLDGDGRRTFVAKRRLGRFRCTLEAVNSERALIDAYVLGHQFLLVGDIENALNCYLDTWKRRSILGDDHDFRIEYGVPAGVMVLAVATDGSLCGEDIPLDEIRRFVAVHIDEFDEEIQWLYAEVQHQTGDSDPILPTSQIPDAEYTRTEDIELDDEENDFSDIVRADKAVFQTMLAYLQGNYTINKTVSG